MFRVVTPPIIRSTHNCIYSNGLASTRYCKYSLCAHDDGRGYRTKHV